MERVLTFSELLLRTELKSTRGEVVVCHVPDLVSSCVLCDTSSFIHLLT